MSLVIVMLWGIGYIMGKEALNPDLIVNTYSGIAAGITAFVSFISYVWVTQKRIYGAALTSYLLMTVTTLIVIASTGDTASPFIALWMIVSMFCGLFGLLYGLLPTVLISAGYLAYLILELSATKNEITVFALAFILPIIVSNLIWHKKNDNENDK
ncbi:hypothetical protein H7Y40_01800, partial [Pedobacter sp.]|nr:hypothetical protein [Candidatus Saccharibacteria bacterium]